MLCCAYIGEEVAGERLSELGLEAEFGALKQSFKWFMFFGREAHITFDHALLGIQLSYMFLLMVTQSEIIQTPSPQKYLFDII